MEYNTITGKDNNRHIVIILEGAEQKILLYMINNKTAEDYYKELLVVSNSFSIKPHGITLCLMYTADAAYGDTLIHNQQFRNIR